MELWKQKANQNTIPRINWKDILGKRCTTFLFLQFENGASKEYCAQLLKEKIDEYFGLYNFHNKNFTKAKMYANARISISARYAEFKRRLKHGI